MSVKKASKNRAVYKNRSTFTVLNALLSSLLMILVYFVYISDLDKNFRQLGIIILAAIITGLIGSWTARVITQVYSNFIKPLNYYVRSLMIDLLYGLLIWAGFITYLWEDLEVWEIIIVWLILKAFLFFSCDYFADQVTFGG